MHLPSKGEMATSDESFRHLLIFAGSGTFVLLWVLVVAVAYVKVFHQRNSEIENLKKSSAKSTTVEIRRKSRANSLFQNVNPYSPVNKNQT